MKKALFFEKQKNKTVQCTLCPHNCIIPENKKGFCKTRKNIKGILYSSVYGKPCALAVDPIEKKPLFHFLPGSKVLSLGTAGCNLGCDFCQNYDTAQEDPENVDSYDLLPEEIVKKAIKTKCKSIGYTYNEPTVFYEYVLDIAKLAHKNGLKNIMVTNGYINQKPLKKLYKYIDAANVDLKGFNEQYYKKTCKAELAPILESIKTMKKMGVWLELTNLIVPGLNDNPKETRMMCRWITDNLGEKQVLHFSRFFPCYKLFNLHPTPIETLKKAEQIAKQEGLKYVYLGNVAEKDITYCPKCSNPVIERAQFNVLKNLLKNGKCSCKQKIDGIFR